MNENGLAQTASKHTTNLSHFLKAQDKKRLVIFCVYTILNAIFVFEI